MATKTAELRNTAKHTATDTPPAPKPAKGNAAALDKLAELESKLHGLDDVTRAEFARIIKEAKAAL